MSKSLSITMVAIDRVSNVSRTVGANILRMADGIMGVSKRIASGVGSLLSGALGFLTSIQTLMAGLLAAIGTGRMVQAFNETARSIKAIGVASGDLGLAVSEMSKLKYVAEQNNSSFEALQVGIKNMFTGLAQAAVTGGSDTSRALTELGINVRDSAGHMRAMSDLLPELADRISGIQDPLTKAAFAEAIFGKQWQEMSRVLEGGGARIKHFGDELERLGGVITPAQLDAAQKYTDSIDHLNAAWEGLWQQTVQRIGPQLAEWINWAAATVAALPDIINNVVSTIQRSTQDVAVAMQMGEVLAKTVEVFKEAGIAAGTIFIAMVRDSIVLGLPLIMDVVKNITKSIVKYFLESFAEAASAVAAVDKINGGKFTDFKNKLGIAVGGLPGGLRSGIDIMGTDFDALANDFRTASVDLGLEIEQDTKNFIANVRDALTSGSSATSIAFTQAMDKLGAASMDAIKTADGVFKISDEIKKHYVAAAPPMTPGATSNPDPTKIGAPGAIDLPAEIGSRGTAERQHFYSFDFKNFTKGLTEGMAQFRDMVNDAETHGVNMAISIGMALSQNVSSAISDVIAGTKSMGDAFREMLSATLRQVSDLIIQLMVMRAISGIAGSFLGGGGYSGVEKTTGRGDIFSNNGVFVNKGGPIDVHRFAGGGGVPGPSYVNRDVVPALLTPGEFVLSQRGRRANSMSDLEYMNRGGSARDLGGGGGLNVNVTIHQNIQGGSAEAGQRIAQQTKTAVVDGVLAALRANPSQRDQMRKVLA